MIRSSSAATSSSVGGSGVGAGGGEGPAEFVDLRLKFNLPTQDYTERTCIIVVEVEMQARRVMLGMIVDYVSEVLNISTDEIEPMPDWRSRCSDSVV